MITLKHTKPSGRATIVRSECPFKQTLCATITNPAKGCHVCDAYSKGRVGPCYPLPAIPTQLVPLPTGAVLIMRSKYHNGQRWVYDIYDYN